MTTLSDLDDDFVVRDKPKGYQRARRKEFCAQGHKFTEENTIWRMARGRKTRKCRACQNAANLRWKKRTGYVELHRSRIGQARDLLQAALAFVDADLAAQIRAFLT